MVGLNLTSYPSWLGRDPGAQSPCNCLPSTARPDSSSTGLRVYFRPLETMTKVLTTVSLA